MATLISSATRNPFGMLSDYSDVQVKMVNIRYDSRRRDQKKSTNQYRNYIDLVKELDRIQPGDRHCILTSIQAKMADPARVEKESGTGMLIYELRLKALALAFFGNREVSILVGRDLSQHAGHSEVHSKEEAAIIGGFSTAIVYFQQGEKLRGCQAFTDADKEFGHLRHVTWLSSSQ